MAKRLHLRTCVISCYTHYDGSVHLSLRLTRVLSRLRDGVLSDKFIIEKGHHSSLVIGFAKISSRHLMNRPHLEESLDSCFRVLTIVA